jgi:hypothetical protein
MPWPSAATNAAAEQPAVREPAMVAAGPRDWKPPAPAARAQTGLDGAQQFTDQISSSALLK